MTGYLDRLIGRTLGLVPTLQPRPRSRFEPTVAGDAGVLDSLLERDGTGGHPHRDGAAPDPVASEQPEEGARSGDVIAADRPLGEQPPTSRAPGHTRPAVVRLNADDGRAPGRAPGVAPQEPGTAGVDAGAVFEVPAVDLLGGLDAPVVGSLQRTLGQPSRKPPLHDLDGAEPAVGGPPPSSTSTPVGAAPDDGGETVLRAVGQVSRPAPGIANQATVEPSPATGVSDAVAVPRGPDVAAGSALDRASSAVYPAVRGTRAGSADRSVASGRGKGVDWAKASVSSVAEPVDRLVPANMPGTGPPGSAGRLSVPGPEAAGADTVSGPWASSTGTAPSAEPAAGAAPAGTAWAIAGAAPADALRGQPPVRAIPAAGQPVSAPPPEVTVTIGRVVVQGPPSPPPPPPPSVPDPGPSQLSLEAYLDRRDGRR